MRDFNFVSIKFQPLFTLSFWKTVKIFFINAVSEIFWPFFAKFFNVLSVWFSLYFFVLFSRMDLCLGWLIFFSISRMLNNEVYSFLSFIFKFQKWRISLFYEVPYIASIFFTFYFVSFYCCPGTYLYFGFIDFCGCWKIFLDFHPENAFQFWNWHIFLDFLVNFCLFFLLISSYLDFSAVFLSKIS